jgi:hypothetical protein
MPPPVPATPTLQQLPKSAAASQIAIRLDSDDNSGHVEVRIRERAGDVQIAVRSTDADVANTLRQDLGDLARRLDPRNSSDSDSGTRQARHSGAGNSSSGYTLPDDRQQQRQRQQQQHTLHHAPQIDAKGDSLQELQNILSEIRNGVVSK